MPVGTTTNGRTLRLFDRGEGELVVLALTAIELMAPQDARMLRADIRRLHQLRDMIQSTPSLEADEVFAGERRSRESLLDTMCAADGFAGDLELPVRGTLTRAFLVLKIQLLRRFVRAADRQFDMHAGEWSALDQELRRDLARSVYTELAESLLLALLREAELPLSTKRRAANQLIAIWTDAEIEIRDFCPLLESAWHARNRANPGLGALLGTAEYFDLIRGDCDAEFLDFFARDDVTVEEHQAFEEFLFDLSYDELCTLRSAMHDEGMCVVSEERAAEILGRPLEREIHEDRIDPVTLHRSFFRRHLAAAARRMSKRPGPRRTAEGYMMVYLLDTQAM